MRDEHSLVCNWISPPSDECTPPMEDPARTRHTPPKFRDAQFVPIRVVPAPGHPQPGTWRDTISAMSHKDTELSHTVPDLVRDLVRRAESKLAELEARKQYLRRRVQALRFLASHNAENPPGERRETAGPQLSSSQRELERGSADQESGKATTRLRRACRIALMENDVPQSSREIYERISKRGSLLFQDAIDPVYVISAELELMAKESEITCRVLDGEKRWHRPSVK
jgi:hypothetical protein